MEQLASSVVFCLLCITALYIFFGITPVGWFCAFMALGMIVQAYKDN